MAHSAQIDDHNLAGFAPGLGIAQPDWKINITRMRLALGKCLRRESYIQDMHNDGFVELPRTQRPGQKECISNEPSCHCWICTNGRHVGELRAAPALEIGQSEFDPGLLDTNFGYVRSELSRRVRIVSARALVQVAT